MSMTLIIGGARSGKSRFAQNLALHLSPNPVYLATSRVWDDDHQARIRRHQADRGPEWTNIEEEKSLSRIDSLGAVVVVDCVTLWLTNYFVDHTCLLQPSLDEATEELERMMGLDNNWLIVTNEIGQGVHASTDSGRKFTDLQGFFNQILATRADNVVLLVAGIPIGIKGSAPLVQGHLTAQNEAKGAIS
jgi:adenosylcobinamide kinase/adenosylcobinamide-phosphate guanylyltransferase